MFKEISKLKEVKDIKNAIVLAIAAITIAIILVIILPFINKSKNESKITTTSSLEQLQSISELSSVKLVYNAIAKKYNAKDKTKIDYYVKYEGTLKAGIDFNKIDVNVNSNKKIITINLPEVMYTDLTVNIGSLKYIYLNKPKESDSVSQEAFKLCNDDLNKRIDNEIKLKETAKENLELFIQEFMKSYVKALGENYKVEIKWGVSNE